MPYFDDILFIHIPKTGGTSLEKYFSKKYNIPLNNLCLYDYPGRRFNIRNQKNRVYSKQIKNLGVSFQHFTLQNIVDNQKELNIKINKIITIVRNPYNKVVSGLN